MHVGKKDTVKDVKQKVFRPPNSLCEMLTGGSGQIRDVRPELQRRRLRLIHSGRLLTDGTFIYSWLTSLEDKQRKAVKEVAAVEEEVLNAGQALTWLHCSVGPELVQEEEEENLSQVRTSGYVVSVTTAHPHSTPRRRLKLNL